MEQSLFYVLCTDEYISSAENESFIRIFSLQPSFLFFFHISMILNFETSVFESSFFLKFKILIHFPNQKEGLQPYRIRQLIAHFPKDNQSTSLLSSPSYPSPPPPSTQTPMQIPTADRFPKELQTTISLTRDVTGTKAKLYAKYITHVLPLGMFILFGVISLFLQEAAGGWK